MTNHAWSEFPIAPDGSREALTVVHHVAHVPKAVQIVHDASLVTSPPRHGALRERRLRVSWVSPNTWNSYIYGNVRFTFDWASLYCANPYAYWIGFEDTGRQKILRIFLSNERHEGLTRINPRNEGGAWQVTASGKHYWNSTYTLEFMVDGLVFLEPHLTDVRFVDHLGARCIEKRTGRCPYQEWGRLRCGAAFVAMAASRGVSLNLRGMIDPDSGHRRISDELAEAVSHVFGRLESFGFTGSVQSPDGGAAALARAMLAVRADELLRPTTHPTSASDYEALAGHFATYEDARRAVADVVARAAAIGDGASLLAHYANDGFPE